MLSQLCPFTKSPFRQTARNHRFQAAMAVLSLFVFGFNAVLPAQALLKMNARAVDAALVYGMKHQKSKLNDILGPNWVEGENGALLNVYSPFMMIAVKAARAPGFSTNPGLSDLQRARKRFGREVSFYTDARNKQQVKFAVSFYGDTPTFAAHYKARIVGSGRGKEFELTPIKQYPDMKADPVSGGVSNGAYEAINAYYFNMADLEDLQEFRLEMAGPQGAPLTFSMKNERLF